MHTIFGFISKRSDCRIRDGFSKTNAYPKSYKEGDAILATEIAYFSFCDVNDRDMPLIFPNDPFHQELKNYLDKITHWNYASWTYGRLVYDKPKLKIAMAKRYKHCMGYINNLRQRYWYWKPINIIVNRRYL